MTTATTSRRPRTRPTPSRRPPGPTRRPRCDDLRPAQREVRATRRPARADHRRRRRGVVAALLGFVIMTRVGRPALRVRRGVGRRRARACAGPVGDVFAYFMNALGGGVVRRLRRADRDRRRAAHRATTLGGAVLHPRVGGERRRRAAAEAPLRSRATRGHHRRLRLRFIPVGACGQRRDDRGGARRDHAASSGCGCSGAVYTVLMAISRTYLGAHWLSDTIGGLLVGAGVALLLWAVLATPLERERLAWIDAPLGAQRRARAGARHAARSLGGAAALSRSVRAGPRMTRGRRRRPGRARARARRRARTVRHARRPLNPAGSRRTSTRRCRRVHA